MLDAMRERDVELRSRVCGLEASAAAANATIARLHADLLAKPVLAAGPAPAPDVDSLDDNIHARPEVSDHVTEDPFANGVGALAKETLMLPKRDKLAMDGGTLSLHKSFELIRDLRRYTSTHDNRLPHSVPLYLAPETERFLLHFAASQLISPPCNSKQCQIPTINCKYHDMKRYRSKHHNTGVVVGCSLPLAIALQEKGRGGKGGRIKSCLGIFPHCWEV